VTGPAIAGKPPELGYGFLAWNAGHGASLWHVEPLELEAKGLGTKVYRPTNLTLCGLRVPDRPIWTSRRSEAPLKRIDICDRCLLTLSTQPSEVA
jgi:hypothetical protein